MKTQKIKKLSLAAAVALCSQGLFAQSYGADINQNDGVKIRANNDNSRHHEYIRFQIGGDNTIAEFNDNAFIFNGRKGSSNIYHPVGTHVNFKSNRGINITSNADSNDNTAEDIQFRVGQNGSITNVAEMSYNKFTVATKTQFQNKVGIGISDPATKLHIREGNMRVDSGEYQSWGSIILHPDVDNNGDDIISFRNSTGAETGKVQDGVLTMNSAVRVAGGKYQATGNIVLHADYDNNSTNDAVIFKNSAGEEKTRVQDGTITTDRVVLNVGSFPDYVFANDYKLMSLKDVEAYIQKNKHLPNMPSEAEVLANGLDVTKVNTVLVEKVEELTLHTINQEKEIEALRKQLSTLQTAIEKLVSTQK